MFAGSIFAINIMLYSLLRRNTKEKLGVTDEELEKNVDKSQSNKLETYPEKLRKIIREGVRAILEHRYLSPEEYIESLPKRELPYTYECEKERIEVHLTCFMSGNFTHLKKLGFTQEECEKYYEQYVNRK